MGLCFSFCGGNLSYHSAEAEFALPLSRLKVLSSAALKRENLREHSVCRRQMEAIWRPPEISQSSKWHICIYLSMHSTEKKCTRATWYAHGKYQLAGKVPGFCSGGMCDQPECHGFWEILLLDLLLPQPLCTAFIRINVEGSSMACHNAVSHSSCKVPCCLIWLISYRSPASFSALLYGSIKSPQ